MPTAKLKFEDLIPVEVDQLRPAGAYGKMKATRAEHTQVYWGDDQRVRSELVEEIPCPLCGGGDHAELFEKEGFRFVECRECGLVFVNPQLREEVYEDVYKDQSYSDIIKNLVASSNDYRKQRFGTERLDIVEQFTGVRGGKLLDIGCTTGFILEEAERRGWDAHGIEANPYAAEVARDKGLKVENVIVEQASFPLEEFDAVTAFDVIEHVRAPLPILEKARDLLKPGGMLFLYVPNWDSASRLIMGSEAHFIWGTHHMTYFTVDTLQQVLDRAGFEVVHHETQGLDIEDIIWWCSNEAGHDTAFLEAYRNQLQFLCNAGDWGKNLRMYARRPIR